MPKITRLGDVGSGHDFCGDRNLASASPNVFINGKGAGRVGDSYTPHSCEDHVPHIGAISGGSQSVFANGRRVGRIGDGISCGGSVAQGSPNVFAGD